MQEQMPQENDDAVVDQIGALMQKLSPEKQMAVVEKLAQMIGGEQDAPQPVENVSLEGGPNGKPVGY